MSFIKKSTSALGKLIIVVLLAATFLVGLVSVVSLSLQGEEIKVPEIVGKNYEETEKELASLGLRIKKRADRYSQESPNTILEQLPKSGDTVKTGQMILVVTSKPNADGTETPMTIQKNKKEEEEDSEKIEELIDDNPKKNSNKANTTTTKKKSSTTRDVISTNSSKSNTSSTNKSTSNNSSNSDSSDTNKSTNPTNKTNPTNTIKPTNTPKPTVKTDGGDTRPRKTP